MGSADSEDYDQVLDSVLVGPVGPGQYKFVLQVNFGRSLTQQEERSLLLIGLH